MAAQNDGEFRRYIGATPARVPGESAEFSAKLDSDFCASLSKAVLVKARLSMLGTVARSIMPRSNTRFCLEMVCRLRRGTCASGNDALWR
jgi:hypothetical protein